MPIDNEYKAYFLGLMYADGYLANTDKCFYAGVIQQDKNYLLKLVGDLLGFNFNGPYLKRSKKTTNPIWELRFTDKNLLNDMINCGILPRKGYDKILSFPLDIPLELMRHFIRGFFDGDGSVSKGIGNGKIMGMNMACNNEGFAKSMHSFICFHANLLIEGNSRGPGFAYNSGVTWYVSFNGAMTCRKIYDFLYKDANFCLLWKHEKFIQLLKMYVGDDDISFSFKSYDSLPIHVWKRTPLEAYPFLQCPPRASSF